MNTVGILAVFISAIPVIHRVMRRAISAEWDDFNERAIR